MKSNAEYHLEELEIALTRGEKHSLPDLPDSFQTILDVGCGAGQTLIACKLKDDVTAFGIDIDLEALALGKKLTDKVFFINATGDKLPFDNESFDVVIARVSLPFMYMPAVLSEIARVAKKGCFIWVALHPFSLLHERLKNGLREGNAKDVIYSVYVFLNSILFHITGRQFRFPLNRLRCESFQIKSSMKRELEKRGLDLIEIKSDKHFIITAVKRSVDKELRSNR